MGSTGILRHKWICWFADGAFSFLPGCSAWAMGADLWHRWYPAGFALPGSTGEKGIFFYCRHGGLYGGGIWNLVDSGSILPRQVVGLFRAVFKSARKDLFRQHCGLFPDWTVGGTGCCACLRRMDSKADV